MAGYSFADVENFVDMGSEHKHRGNDSMQREGDKVYIAYRGNVIATYYPATKKMTITDAGWRTHTTKDRLNKIIPSGSITQYLGEWYLEKGGKMVPFVNDMDVTKSYPEAKPFEEMRKSAGHEYRISKKIKKLDEEHEKEMIDEAITPIPSPSGTSGMSVDFNKIPSDDPIAFSFGWETGMSGQPMEVAPRGESLAQEYVRGYKLGVKKRREELDKMFAEARKKNEEEEKKPSLFDSKKAQVPLTMTRVPKLGSLGSGWHKEPVSHSYATKYGKAPKSVRGR